jgi:hypothetical protein
MTRHWARISLPSSCSSENGLTLISYNNIAKYLIAVSWSALRSEEIQNGALSPILLPFPIGSSLTGSTVTAAMGDAYYQ